MARKILFCKMDHDGCGEICAALQAAGYEVEVTEKEPDLLKEEKPDLVLLFWSQYKAERLHRLLLEGIPAPAWIVACDRRILAQNKAAEREWDTKVGEYCFLSIHKGAALRGEYRKAWKRGTILPETRCYFCRADEALEKAEPIRCEIKHQKRFFDVFWVPLGENFYLHYTHDITPYREAEKTLRYLAFHDPLTGAYNRRFFFETLSREIERAKRRRETFSLLLFDLDHFKTVNDRFGHTTGDRVLQEVVREIRKKIRKMDILARLGGEEFVVLLPATPKEKAHRVAQAIRNATHTVGERLGFPLTVSIGITEHLPGESADALLSRVDTLMYKAKDLGRDCICES